MKLKINDYVYYALNGICKVCDIQSLNLGNETKNYYILSPINSTHTFFIPTDNDIALSKIKKILNKEEIDQLIIESKNINIDWPKNSKERNVYLQGLLKLDDFKTTVAVIAKIIKTQESENKLSSNDLIILSNAQNLINTSLAYSLNISKDDVSDYILNILK